MEDTEPRVQRLFHGLYRETGVGPQGLAGAGLCGCMRQIISLVHFIYDGEKSISRSRMDHSHLDYGREPAGCPSR